MLSNPEHPYVDRALFPFSALPRMRFSSREVPLSLAPVRWITDTTFRDGQQARAPYTCEQILKLYTLLHRLDAGCGVIRASEFFIYTATDRAAVAACRTQGYAFPEITAWIRAVPDDLALVHDVGLTETGILTSVSDYHIYTKLGLDRRRAADQYLRIVDAALNLGIRPRCHFEDVTRADIFGFVVPFAQALMERSQDSGIPITIRLCDTMGVALPWSAVSAPRGVPQLLHTLQHEAGVPSAQLEWHGHNDFFKGHANAVAAWLYGCASINSTLLSTGERTGNTPLEGAVVDFLGLAENPGLDLPVLVEIATYLQEICHVALPSNYPILGSECFTTRAGVHIDGLLKDPETYLSFDPRVVLQRPIGVIVSDKSGAAGIAWWLNEHCGLTGSHRIEKNHPGVLSMYADLQEEYAAGRITDPTDEELTVLMHRYFPLT